MKLVRMRPGEVARGSRKPIYDFRNTNNNNDDVDDDDDEHNDVDVGKLFSIVMTPRASGSINARTWLVASVSRKSSSAHKNQRFHRKPILEGVDG